jgi:SNF family Na+-dependent transporter
MEKLISSVKSLFGSHVGMMILCCVAMLGAVWGISGIQFEEGGMASLILLLPLALCLGMHFVMHRFMGHGTHEHGHDENHQARMEGSERPHNPGERNLLKRPVPWTPRRG